MIDLPIRLMVDMPAFGACSIRGRYTTGDTEKTIETQVHRLKRPAARRADATAGDSGVWGLAWAPESYRSHIKAKGRLIDREYVWCWIRLAFNRKSLAPFLASDVDEWPAPAPKLKAAELAGADLDLAVSLCAGIEARIVGGRCYARLMTRHRQVFEIPFSPSTDGADSASLIERFKIGADYSKERAGDKWAARCEGGSAYAVGSTHTEATARAVVVYRWGAEFDGDKLRIGGEGG